jgi:hypothetical protein
MEAVTVMEAVTAMKVVTAMGVVTAMEAVEAVAPASLYVYPTHLQPSPQNTNLMPPSSEQLSPTTNTNVLQPRIANN